jgi:hypothetical protein
MDEVKASSPRGRPRSLEVDRAILREFLRQNHQAFVNSPIYSMVGTLLIEERRNPELFQIFREKAIHPRRAQLRMILERGVQRGDIRPDVDLDVAMETLVGALYACHIAGLPETAEWLEGVVDVVWHGLDYSVASTKDPAPKVLPNPFTRK